MENPPKFKSYQEEARGSKITDRHIRSFGDLVVWPAVDHACRDNFREVAEITDEVGEALPSVYLPDDTDEKIVIPKDYKYRVIPGLRAFCEKVEARPGAPSHRAVVGLSSLRFDKTKDLSKRDRAGAKIWETWSYEFQSTVGKFSIQRYFELLTKEGDPIERPRDNARDYIEDLGSSESIFTYQACHDVYNILLALEIPEDKMRYDRWRRLIPANAI